MIANSEKDLNPEIAGLKPRYIGALWNKYTPQVESQLTRDVIALLDVAYNRRRDEEIIIVSEQPIADAVLSALGVRRVPLIHLARTWIVYRTDEEWPEEPNTARTVIPRDLYQRVKPGNLMALDAEHSRGYYLPPQGRPNSNSLGLKRPAPNGYSPVNPLALLQWM